MKKYTGKSLKRLSGKEIPKEKYRKEKIKRKIIRYGKKGALITAKGLFKGAKFTYKLYKEGKKSRRKGKIKM